MTTSTSHPSLAISRRTLLKAAALGLLAGTLPGLGLVSSVYSAPTSGQSTLIVYYSRTGNTRALGQQIQEITGGKLVELSTVEPYPDAYRATTDQAKRELASGYLPPLATTIDNMDDYDTIIIGSPNWWSTMAVPVHTFLSQYDLSGKTVTLFLTHEGSGLGRSMDDLRTFCPQATVLDGLAVRGRQAAAAQKEARQWLQQIGLIE